MSTYFRQGELVIVPGGREGTVASVSGDMVEVAFGIPGVGIERVWFSQNDVVLDDLIVE